MRNRSGLSGGHKPVLSLVEARVSPTSVSYPVKFATVEPGVPIEATVGFEATISAASA